MKSKFRSILLLLSISATMLNAQTFSWVRQFGGPLEGHNKVVATDANGNVYTCGRFSGTVDFDPGTNTYVLTAGNLGAMFISKLNASGDFIWARQIDGNPDGLNLAVGLNGSVYITGNFSGVVDVDPGAGMNNLTTTSVGGSCAPHLDIFILKLDADGNFMWAGQIGGTGDDYAGSDYHKAGGGISLGTNDAIYLGGGIGRENNVNILSSPLVDFDPSPGNSTNSSVTAPSFVVKLDSSGTFNWVNTWEGGEASSGGCSNISDASCHAIALDNAGNVYYTGKVGGWQAFVRKISGSGVTLWSATLSGGLSVAYDIAIDANGNVYTTGYFAGTSDFDPSAAKYELKSFGSVGGSLPNTAVADAFVWKLNASGTYQWVGQLGGANLSVGRSIDLDAAGNIYTSGYFTGTNVDFNPHKSLKYLLNASGGEDAFIAKLTSTGTFVWAVKFGGTLNERAYGIDVDASGNIYHTGTFEGTVDFNPSSATANLAAFGLTDVYVHKMTQASLRIGEENEPSLAEAPFHLYPNPAHDKLNIRSNAMMEHIEIYDAMGRKVYNFINQLPGADEIALDISSLEGGLYFIRVRNGENYSMQKFIVQ